MGYRAAEQVIRKNITIMRNVSDKRVIHECITRLFNQSPLSIYVDQMINVYIYIYIYTFII